MITFDATLIGELANGSRDPTLLLRDGELIITSALDIADPGSVLPSAVAGAPIFRFSADKKSRVLFVDAAATVHISGLTFADGRQTETIPGQGSDSAHGGGIFNEGDLTLSQVIVEDNFANNEGGGVYNAPGATLSIDRSTIRRNQTNFSIGNGGGISNHEGQLDITTSTITENQAGSTDQDLASGGGIATFGSSTTTISRSTISHNTAQRDGGGIRAGFPSTIVIDNSTISNNRTLAISSASFGGGLHVLGDAELYHVTIADNESSGSGGGFYEAGGTFTIANSIVSGNRLSSGTSTQNGGQPRVGLPVSATTSSKMKSPDWTGDDFVGAAEIGPLADNGGPTQTHLIKPGSPAIDGADPSLGPMRLVDQRGRPIVDLYPGGGIPDSGAYEVQQIGFNDLELLGR